MNNTYKLHKQFFQILTKNKLNELLNRADEKTHYLETELNTLLPQGLRSKVEVSKNTLNKCSIYISFYKNSNSDKFAHYTFHLYPENTTMPPNTRKLGRLHIKNNRNKRFKYVLDIQKQYSQTNQTDYLQLSLDKSKAYSRDLEQCVKITQTVLNNYFNPEHQNYLGNHLTKLGDQQHKCFSIITSSMNKAKVPMKNTRKVKRN